MKKSKAFDSPHSALKVKNRKRHLSIGKYSLDLELRG
jgi:hypothetical protein